MGTAHFTNLRSLMVSFAKAMNLVNPEIQHHHEQTAYLALFIARELRLPEEDVMLTMTAALFHDIGSIVVEAPQTVAEVERRAREYAPIGARMLRGVPGFEEVASVISYNQCSWGEAIAVAIEQDAVSERLGICASIVHLADAVSTLINDEGNILNQASKIIDVVKSQSGVEFCPQAVGAFVSIAELEYVWMDLMHNPMFITFFTGEIGSVSLERTVELTSLASSIIDYRSPFTAMHSAGVAASARTLAKLAGFDEECQMKMQIAGNLHDIGKLAVPRAILEKPGKLTNEEFNIVKEHPYYTALILLDVKGFEQVNLWASRHHEKLTGHGYPFHNTALELDVGARIMAVADIFSAITEERPYRTGMSREQAEKVLREDVRAGDICDDIVALLMENYDEVNGARDEQSHIAGKRYFESIGQ